MATQAPTRPTQSQTLQEKAHQLRQLYNNAPAVAQKALDNAREELMKQAVEAQAAPTMSAGRVGMRQGTVSELTLIAPFAPGGAERLRAVTTFLNGNFGGGKKLGTLHDMRFVFLDNDTKLLFCTAYDGAWDPYIEDFAAKIPDEMDVVFSACEGWPGIRNTQATKDWIADHQISAEGWFVDSPDLTARDTRRLARIGKAVDEFLDKINS